MFADLYEKKLGTVVVFDLGVGIGIILLKVLRQNGISNLF